MIEYFESIVWGMIIGFSVAIPIGPISLVCIQRTLANNKISGLISGLGVAIADTLLASIAIFSITIIFSFINRHEFILRIISATILIIIGIVSIKKDRDIKKIKAKSKLGYLEEFITAFIITITNPITTFFFFITFSGIGNSIGRGFDIAIIFSLGIFLGSCLWWIILTYITEIISHKITENHLKTINKWFGIIILAVGLFILISVLFRHF